MRRSRWYAIRVAPGYQRMAAADDRLPESRQMESIVERNCRKDGFDIFMPSFYTELRHHRTKQIVQKRFPFLVGYAFVNLPRLNFEEPCRRCRLIPPRRRKLRTARVPGCDHRSLYFATSPSMSAGRPSSMSGTAERRTSGTSKSTTCAASSARSCRRAGKRASRWSARWKKAIDSLCP